MHKAVVVLPAVISLLSLCLEASAGVSFIDRDGDGYGVGSPLGPDADDNDPFVNTTQSVLSRYGSFDGYLQQMGYSYNNLYWVAPGAAPGSGKPNDPNAPYHEINEFRKQLKPGDMVVYRGGEYDKTLRISDIQGTRENPVVVMAYPGEKVTITTIYEGIAANNVSNVIVDGFNLSGKGTNYGIKSVNASDLTFRNLNVEGFWLGWSGMYNQHNIVGENSVFKNNGSHGVYWGSVAVDPPNTNLVLRDTLIYGNGKHGFQHNGQVLDMLLEGNVIHSNTFGGISLAEGVSDSVVRNNLIFNNARQGIIFFMYVDTNSGGIEATGQYNNLVEGNTIWIGKYSADGRTEPNAHAAIAFQDNSKDELVSILDTIIRNNVLVTQNGPVLFSSDQKMFDGSIFEDNLIFRVNGDSNVVTIGDLKIPLSELVGMRADFLAEHFADPMFNDVSILYWNNPALFDFARVPEPATAAVLLLGGTMLLVRRRRR